MGAEQGTLRRKTDKKGQPNTGQSKQYISKALDRIKRPSNDSKKDVDPNTLDEEERTNTLDNVNQSRRKVWNGKHRYNSAPPRNPPDGCRKDLRVPKEKCYDPKDSSLVIVDAEDNMDFELEGFNSPRAMMSCGHTVTPQSLTNWCKYQLDQGKDSFVCGACKAPWPLEEVYKMALLTLEEEEYFENKLFSRWSERNGAISCPGCNSEVLRTDLHNLCVQCTVCTKNPKIPFFFCWQCLEKWRGPAPRSDHCDNYGCVDVALETLKSCPEMTFDEVKGITGCPSMRACPTCGLLLGHNGTKCKNIVCPRCKKEFCFVCLKPTVVCSPSEASKEMLRKEHRKLFYIGCSSGVAPRQTQIPMLPPVGN